MQYNIIILFYYSIVVLAYTYFYNYTYFLHHFHPQVALTLRPAKNAGLNQFGHNKVGNQWALTWAKWPRVKRIRAGITVKT